MFKQIKYKIKEIWTTKWIFLKENYTDSPLVTTRKIVMKIFSAMSNGNDSN